MAYSAQTIWRDYVTDGVPSSGAHKAKKADIRAWGSEVETAIVNNGSFATLASLLAKAPNTAFAYVDERSSGAGGGCRWAKQASEPAVPTLAKAQDANGIWWLMQPDKGEITVEMMGAKSGFLIDADTRTIFNALGSSYRTTEHLYLIDQAVRRFRRILGGSMTKVTWSIVNGEVVFVPNSGTIRAEQYDGCLFVKSVYGTFATSKKGQGRIVTSGELDAVEAINGTTNAAAIQAAIDYASQIGANVRLLGETYPVATTIRAILPVTISGVPGGRTRLYGVNTMPYNNPVFQTGEVGIMAENVWVKWIRFDGNLRRLSGLAGAVTGAPSGTACAFVYQRGGGAENCMAFDARKHCFDITGSSYPSSGTAGVVADQIKEMSDGVVLSYCWAEGAGDDEFTTHAARKCGFEHCTAMFNTGTDTNNSIAFEFDDGTEDSWGIHLKAAYAGCGLQIKGHNAGRPAQDIFVDDIDIYKTNNGVMNWHTDFDSDRPRWSGATGVTVKNARWRNPLAWIEAETTRCAVRCYAYDNVKIQIKVSQESADPAYFNTGATVQGAFQLYGQVGDMELEFSLTGFATGVYGVNITSSALGPIRLKKPNIIDGPLTAIRQATTGAYCVVEPHHIIRSTSGGTTGILGAAAIMTTNNGRVVNYTTGVSVT